ncbi:MAG TPA: hypothetical protein DDZ80_23220 [Cyanobacteria bacterium UBA8803]|nr:hypothetical protein [Cyanobacteria bacterium UBA9273]HBL61238.1 hypothetical protein [Cyanobacteria bacterium UBA8803]
MLRPNRFFYYCLLVLFAFILVLGIGVVPGYSTFNQSGAIAIQPNGVDSLVTLEQQARQLYETGQFVGAAQLLKQAAAEAADRGELLVQARILRNLALVYQQLGELALGDEVVRESIDILDAGDNLGNGQEVTRLMAQALEVRGQLELAAGQPERALETWKKATATYRESDDVTGMSRSQINQAQALQKLGLYRQALRTLTQVGSALQAQPDSLLKAQSLQSLGEALRVVGDLPQSQQVLQNSLAIAEQLQAHDSMVATLISLGNVAYMQQQPDLALGFYQRAVAASASPTTRIQAQLNQLRVLVEDEQQKSQALALVPQIESELDQLPPSRTTIYGRINLAESLIKLGSSINSDVEQVLVTALQQARSIEDKRSQSYALGTLGRLHEGNQQWDEARQFTQDALLLAQGIGADDIAYQWQWQLGRVLKVQGNLGGAIAAYTEAVKTLKSIRSDLVAISSNVQFSFRETVEPVYRELVGLLLKPEAKEFSQDPLDEARQVIESLQLAELDNFFQDACIDAKPAQIDRIDQTAAVFYPIILSDRLDVILALPGQPLRHYSTLLPRTEINDTLKSFREAITVPSLQLSIKNTLRPAQKLYDWLIRPVAADLTASGVNTLVFVPDGAIRNIPISALHDGKQYLVENYSIAIAPGLQLVDPQPLAGKKLKVLAFGLSQARQDFAPLPNVELELQRIQTEVPSQVLLNEAFTNANFQKAIKSSPAPVVHLATHGEFSSEADKTFVLAWDVPIKAREFDQLLRTEPGNKTQPIELLVLSACQTAAGDNRAALGLAGVAVRAGARSTLASLWFVSDEATSLLMTKFYQELATNQNTKAEVLRQSQLEILRQKKFSHPYYWAAFILVGNWL